MAADLGATVHYTLEIEQGLPFVARATAMFVVNTLNDARGWRSTLGTSFGQVSADPEVRVVLASPGTTDELCRPLQTRGRVSCRNGEMVVLNARRWATAVPHFDGRTRVYRRYVLNHEMGHALGRPHVSCPAPGQPAPVMQQQTYGLDGCRANGWPGVA